ncbi:CPBP family intramembrane metalloprotease [Ruegeria sp. 2012CJ41-6]|uniref:CPBP family intramembrane metalloprotease n=1 Tax=Ruegeria spongiae TaxID=2942209 RepID=A0ABT0Q0M8_9RHOB|nr:CPBP family intramembrane glutamic endopeptidase [Ruegeria spongiae]MCL6283370.1 CPBP family intramembrane metalloprotease [Ruegeria spongiae]
MFEDLSLYNTPTNRRLKAEFGLFFLAAPIVIAVLLPPTMMFQALFAFTGLGLGLLHFTPGFQWAELWHGWRNWTWRELALFAVLMLALCTGLIYVLRPEAAFFLLRQRPELLAVIWLAYPLVSALPQELLFRPLFFRRYAAILPEGPRADLLNAAIFSFAHLMYWSWVVALMTFAGGLLFSWAYRRRGSFVYAMLLHAVAGNILFAVGMGVYFYSGNVVRPF